jgi:hypothetical protein
MEQKPSRCKSALFELALSKWSVELGRGEIVLLKWNGAHEFSRAEVVRSDCLEFREDLRYPKEMAKQDLDGNFRVEVVASATMTLLRYVYTRRRPARFGRLAYQTSNCLIR